MHYCAGQKFHSAFGQPNTSHSRIHVFSIIQYVFFCFLKLEQESESPGEFITYRFWDPVPRSSDSVCLGGGSVISISNKLPENADYDTSVLESVFQEPLLYCIVWNIFI